jgi:hypothetical protein
MEREPSLVWMVHRRTGPEGQKGELALESGRVVFSPTGGADPTAFPLEDIRGVRRVIGSPVLELRLASRSEFRMVGFYFIQPPSLDPADGTGRVMKRRAARKGAVVKLRTWNAAKREEIRSWVNELRPLLGGQPPD